MHLVSAGLQKKLQLLNQEFLSSKNVILSSQILKVKFIYVLKSRSPLLAGLIQAFPDVTARTVALPSG